MTWDPATTVRWDKELGEWQYRCERCRVMKRQCYWPLTFEFWDPRRGMNHCIACVRELDRIKAKARYADPIYREKHKESVRLYDLRVGKAKLVKRRMRYQRQRKDPEWVAKQRAYQAAYRARMREERQAA